MFFSGGGGVSICILRMNHQKAFYCLELCSKNLQETATYTDVLGRRD